jgi:hypothetical protein
MTVALPNSYETAANEAVGGNTIEQIGSFLDLHPERTEQSGHTSDSWPFAHTLVLALFASGAMWSGAYLLVRHFW